MTSSTKLTIGYFYGDLLNLYGDRGNVEILLKRATSRGIHANVLEVTLDTTLDTTLMQSIDLVFMGGGPDSSQKMMYLDLVNNKGKYLRDYIENNGVGLYVCGSYQLLGKYYKSADGTHLAGLDILDLYTENFGNKKPRCLGNIVCKINPLIETKVCEANAAFESKILPTLVGFENHGGRTYLGSSLTPLGTVQTGFGNNGDDSTEGLVYKNSICTYLHGPLLARNPHLADYLIATALKMDTLSPLDDSLVWLAHDYAIHRL